GQAQATLSLSNLSATYDGSPHAALATTNPPGLSGVSVTYSQNGVAVGTPIYAGVYTVTATLNNPDYLAPAVTATLTIGQATPTISWATPAPITAGTPLGAGQLDAIASVNGSPLSGAYTYAPAAGTVLSAGNGQTLTVTFNPADSADFKSVSASVLLDVRPTQPPPSVVLIGEQPVFRRKLNKKGKSVGKPVLIGFKLDFNLPIDAAAASTPANYHPTSRAANTVKPRLHRLLHPIKGCTVSYTPAADSVTLKLPHPQSFAKGGQLTVLPGVTGASAGVLAGTTTFAITPGA